MPRSLFDPLAHGQRVPGTSADGGPIELGVPSEQELLRVALELGAEQTGGELTAAEQDLVRAAGASWTGCWDLVQAAREAIRRGEDPLGAAFCRLRSTAQRRQAGVFYTQPVLVDPMIDWVLAQRPDRLVDAGCGSGRFTTAALRRRPDMPVLAIDLDPMATLLTRAALSVLGSQNATVLQCDYTEMTLPPILGRTAFVGNPPYVRHHELSARTKAWALLAARSLGLSVSGLSGLHAYFFLATALHAQTGDAGCFVTSAEWLDVNYGAIIRALLTGRLGGQALHVLDPQAVPFEDAMTTAAITCFEVGSSVESVRFRSVPRLDALESLGCGDDVSRGALTRSKRWSPFLHNEAEADLSTDLVPLGSIARVHRGVVTGSNDFFILTREQARGLGVEEWCQPAITSAKEIQDCGGTIRDGPERRLLLELPRDLNRQLCHALDEYLKLGEQPLGADDPVCRRYIPSHRRPWWHLGPARRPPIVATYMARQAPVFALNPDGLALINIGHGIYPIKERTPEALTSLVEALNQARVSFVGSGRTYHGGLEKFEPREMESLLVPATFHESA